MKNLSEKEISDRIIREFASELRHRLGKRIRKIILYGSRARGDFWEGSDYDFLVLADKKSKQLEDLVLDIEGEFLDRYDRLITSHILTLKQWEIESRFPWGLNVEKEGVVI